MNAILDWFKLEVVLGLGALVSFLTQLFKMLPPEWTSSRPKTVAFVIAAIVVGIIGYYEGADISTVATVTVGSAIAAVGLYEVVKSIYLKLK